MIDLASLKLNARAIMGEPTYSPPAITMLAEDLLGLIEALEDAQRTLFEISDETEAGIAVDHSAVPFEWAKGMCEDSIARIDEFLEGEP